MKYAFAMISAAFAGLAGAVDPWFAIPAVYAGFAALDGIVGSQLRAAPPSPERSSDRAARETAPLHGRERDA